MTKIPTPNLDKARSEELTSWEVACALRELRRLDPNAGPMTASIGVGGCAVEYANRSTLNKYATEIEDALVAAHEAIIKAMAE